MDYSCSYTNQPAEYRIGAIQYKKKRVAFEVGACIKAKVLTAIEEVTNQCFGSKLWAAVLDLNGNVIYRADIANKEGFSAKEGWRQYLSKNKK